MRIDDFVVGLDEAVRRVNAEHDAGLNIDHLWNFKRNYPLKVDVTQQVHRSQDMIAFQQRVGQEFQRRVDWENYFCALFDGMYQGSQEHDYSKFKRNLNDLLTHEIWDRIKLGADINVEALKKQAQAGKRIARANGDSVLAARFNNLAIMRLPKQYSGPITMNALEHVTYHGLVPDQDLIGRMARAYSEFESSGLDRFLFGLGIHDGAKREEGEKFARIMFEEFENIGMNYGLGEVSFAVAHYVDELAQVDFYPKPNFGEVSRGLVRLVRRGNNSSPDKIVESLGEYEQALQQRKGHYKKSTLGYLMRSA